MNTTLLLLAFLASTAQAAPVTCTSPNECEVMWSKVQELLPAISAMRVRLLTNDRIETFAPIRGGTYGAVITKSPRGENYVIRLEAICLPSYTDAQTSACNGVGDAMADALETWLTAK